MKVWTLDANLVEDSNSSSNSLASKVHSDLSHDLWLHPERSDISRCDVWGGGLGQVHDLLEAKGKQICLDLDISRGVVEAAAAYMSYEDANKAFIFSDWTQAALPHRRLPDEQTWQITSERATLLVEPGKNQTLFKAYHQLPLEYPMGPGPA